ncbi:MAG: hypothetical protein ACREQK_08325, partial [Candidatus Binatia bacterium]
MSAIPLFLLLSFFTVTVYLSVTSDLAGVWRQLRLKERILRAFLLIVSSLVVLSYVLNVSIMTAHALPGAK